MRVKIMKTFFRKIKSIKDKIFFPASKRKSVGSLLDPKKQDLDLYWDPDYAEALETWGEDNTWKEIPFLLVNCKGKILDIACGTGRTMEILSGIRGIEMHGCDISNLLIGKAIERGINPDRLSVCDATQMNFPDIFFDYAYSIGSLEHFTEDGISKFISECYRVTKNNSFHMLPVSRSGKNEGWMKTVQSFHNNSVDWWLDKFKTSYNTVYVFDSKWEDAISVGKWFVCIKDNK
jgi:ubiquinone/menaquinone biosynthesis C-methylase UbiE